ncbi:cupin [Herbiconiux moechotypicola]|uniref:cupin n=1 Tax=Herbiconiux moechotypicola TaxID=637393 RepID=UPI00217E5DFF|nr:cupin [Herbiconiux moechotypicola]MCS5732029.1 cupin [Herbiconiux moechotypicola]
MAQISGETTIDDGRIRVTRWAFDRAGDKTGFHVHEFDYVVVPITGGRLTATDADRATTEMVQVAGASYTGPAGRAHDVAAQEDGVVFVEVELLQD